MGDMVVVRKEGLYCVPGQFYIDPWRPVDRAVITHAHGDHARVGHGHYLAAEPGIGVLKSRLGDITVDAMEYGQSVTHNGVKISLHPAGHVLGSAQVRMEIGGEVWVASGDYKVEPDKTCAPFEPVRCALPNEYANTTLQRPSSAFLRHQALISAISSASGCQR